MLVHFSPGRSRGVAWPNTRPCQGRERRFESGRDRQLLALPHARRGGRARLKATVSKTVIGATLSWVRIPPSPPIFEFRRAVSPPPFPEPTGVTCLAPDTNLDTNRRPGRSRRPAAPAPRPRPRGRPLLGRDRVAHAQAGHARLPRQRERITIASGGRERPARHVDWQPRVRVILDLCD